MVQKLVSFNRSMRLDLHSKCYPMVAMLAQGQLHINPPIKIIGSCEERGSRVCELIISPDGRLANIHTSYVAPVNFTTKTLKHMNCYNHDFPHWG